jgi:hypothetical protein
MLIAELPGDGTFDMVTEHLKCDEGETDEGGWK